jgi:hypothetical protein
LQRRHTQLEPALATRTKHYQDIVDRAGRFKDLSKQRKPLRGQWQWLGGACKTDHDVELRMGKLGLFDERLNALESALLVSERSKREHDSLSERSKREHDSREILERNRKEKQDRKKLDRQVEATRYSITREKARDLVSSHPPRSGVTDGRRYIAQVPEEDVAATGFAFNDADYELIMDVLKAFHSEQQRKIEQRKARFKRDDPNTWECLREIRYVDVTEAQIGPANAQIVDDIRNCVRPGNTQTGRIQPIVDARMHDHLDGGSGGVAFIYVQEDDGRVRPVIYDIAFSRRRNQYVWRRGGTGYNSSASYE